MISIICGVRINTAVISPKKWQKWQIYIDPILEKILNKYLIINSKPQPK